MKIAITGLHAVENPSPGLSVARSLRHDSRKLELIGYAYHPLYTGTFDDVWDEVRLVANPLEVLDDILRQEITILFPTIDYEIETLCSRSTLVPESLGLPPLKSIQRVAKANLPQLASSIGLRVPDTLVASSLAEVESALAELSGKGVVKGAVYGGFVVNDPLEGCQVARKLLGSDKIVLVQRWIDGEEFGLAGVAWRGQVLGAVAMRKLGMSDGGTTWCGVSIDCADIMDYVNAFCEETKWTGGFELEMIQERSSRINYLIEINARFPSWIFLGAVAGANLPALLLDAVAGQIPAEPRIADAGMVFARAFTDLVRPISELAGFILEGHRP
jgi:carbamoyl-phosphate synthase large subunit